MTPADPVLPRRHPLEREPDYTDDRLAQARAVADLGTDPSIDGSLPVIVVAT